MWPPATVKLPAGSVDYVRGARAADTELRAGTASLWACREKSTEYEYDPDTGLGVLPVKGSAANPALRELVRGHNDRIHGYVRLRGVPANSRKRWNALLDDPWAYAEKRARVVLRKPGDHGSSHGVKTSFQSQRAFGPLLPPEKRMWPHVDTRSRFRVSCQGRTMDVALEHGKLPADSCFAFLVGPPGSDLVLMLWSDSNGAEGVEECLFLDLRMGHPLCRQTRGPR